MITLTIINLLKLPFESGMSHHVKATYGSLAVSGCGFRYGNSAPCFAASHFPSLHVGADPQGDLPVVIAKKTSNLKMGILGQRTQKVK
jgi:hypothetical protein